MSIYSDAPEQKFKVLRKLIPRRIQPLLRGIRKRFQRPISLEYPYSEVFPYTQAHIFRQMHLVALAEDVETRKVPGSIVECGVCDGGTAALMARATNNGRSVHLFDSWKGLPNPSEKDGESALQWAGQFVGSPARVVRIMDKLGIDRSRLVFHRGWFNETFPHADIDQVALLHIDADFYDSVQLCLQTWYERISPGGYVQFDDYDTFVGCKRAVDEFLAKHPDVHLKSAGENVKAWFFQKPDSSGV